MHRICELQLKCTGTTSNTAYCTSVCVTFVKASPHQLKNQHFEVVGFPSQPRISGCRLIKKEIYIEINQNKSTRKIKINKSNPESIPKQTGSENLKNRLKNSNQNMPRQKIQIKLNPKIESKANQIRKSKSKQIKLADPNQNQLIQIRANQT